MKPSFTLFVICRQIVYAILSAIFLVMFGTSIKLGVLWVKLHESIISNIGIVTVCIMAGTIGLAYGLNYIQKIITGWKVLKLKKEVNHISQLMDNATIIDKDEFEQFIQNKMKEMENTDDEQ